MLIVYYESMGAWGSFYTAATIPLRPTGSENSDRRLAADSRALSARTRCSTASGTWGTIHVMTNRRPSTMCSNTKVSTSLLWLATKGR